MRFFLIFLSLLFQNTFLFSQQNASNVDFKTLIFDSLIVQTIYDMRYDQQSLKQSDKVVVTASSKVSAKDAKVFTKRIIRKSSYGNSQAITPVPDLEFLYFKNGKIIAKISICLFANNFIPSIDIDAQRQGWCACESGGACCSKGGINRKFKKYIIRLMRKNNLPVNKDEILDFGK